MFILSFSEYFSITLSQSNGNHLYTCEPDKAYLFSEFIFDELRKGPARLPLSKISSADPVLKGFNVAQFPPPRDVLFYMGVGGMGDNIMSWGVVRHLAEMGYRMHILCLPIMEFCWHGFPWVESIVFLPNYWSAINCFDHHVIFETISNSYTHEQQMHPLDAMLAKVGVDASTIPAERKRVAPVFSRQEQRVAEAMYPGKELAFFQLSPSQRARQLPPEKSRAVLSALALAFPQFHWIALGGGTTNIGDSAREPLTPLRLARHHVGSRGGHVWHSLRGALGHVSARLPRGLLRKPSRHLPSRNLPAQPLQLECGRPPQLLPAPADRPGSDPLRRGLGHHARGSRRDGPEGTQPGAGLTAAENYGVAGAAWTG